MYVSLKLLRIFFNYLLTNLFFRIIEELILRMMIMEYELAYIGKIKMTVGIRRRTHEKVQYCITAIQSI